MQLEAGDYIIRASPDERIRVSFAGNTGNAAADLGTSGTHANLAIRDTPHSNFRAIVEVPATSDLTVHLSGGNLEVAAITGNKDIDSKAGNVGIAIPNSNDYGTVDAAVKVGDLQGWPLWRFRVRTCPAPQMVGVRQVRVARQSWCRQLGTEALKTQGMFTKACTDASRDQPQIGSRYRRSRTAVARNAAATARPIHRPGLIRNAPGLKCINGSIDR